MMIRRSLVGALSLLAIGCGYGNRTGFEVAINPDAVANASSLSIPADMVMVEPRAGNVVFSHGVHMIFAEGCETCHPEPWSMKQSPSGTTLMEPMYEGESCGTCHDGQTAFAATACIHCHDLDSATATLPDVTLPGGNFGPTVFSHNLHRMAGSTCEQCHPEPWRWAISPPGTLQMTPMYNGESCGECHDGQDAFDATDCGRCHDRDAATPPTWLAAVEVPEDSRWPGTEEYGEVVFNHVNHSSANLMCNACHPDLFGTTPSEPGVLLMNDMYAGRACGACHNGRTSFPATECAACHEGAQPPVKAG